MNVLLIRPPDPLQHVQLLSHTKPMNLAYLAAYLREHGIDVWLVDYEISLFEEKNFIRLVKDRGPSIIGVSCMTPTIKNGAQICALAKKVSDKIVTVVGGPHANGLPVQTMEEFSVFDYLVYGEGEVTLLELCHLVLDGGDAGGINGLVYRDGDSLVKNNPRGLIKNLDAIPFPARDLVEFDTQSGHFVRGFTNKILSTELFTSRGCPIGCSFCAIQTTFGKTVRFRDLSYVEEEIRQFKDEYAFNHVVVADDTFTLRPDRVLELCDIFKRTGITSWNCDTRVSTVSREMLLEMKKSGCQKVAFGVESGSQRIMDLVGKKITVEKVEHAVNWAKEAGIKHIEGNFIIGAHPSETIEDIEKTEKLIRSLPWTFVSVTVIVPYPGTEVYAQMKQNDCLDDDLDWQDFVMFGKKPKWRTEHFSADELVRIQKSLTRKFYLNPKYILKQLFSIRSWAEADYWCSSGISYLNWYFTGRI
ncbi:MAG: B12-binding domain-containing radical SAM protein [Desulfamplus sp.]|nr:B12-binding domain-containing radical SAM protein [Desulfamplus sp.]